MKRRIIAAVLTAMLGALAGCSPAASAPSASSASSASEPVELRVLVSTNPASDEYYKNDLIPAFEKKYPNIKVTFDSAATDGYWGVVKTRLAAGAVDAAWAWGSQLPPSYATGATPTDFQSLVKAGAFVDQSGQSYVDRWLQDAVNSSTIDGKIYALPSGSNIVNGVYYSKAIFTKYGLSVPKTWSEFVALNDTLVKNGVTPFAIGGKDVWPTGLIMLGLVQSTYPDMDALNKGLWDGSVKLTDAASVSILDKLKTIFSYTQKTFPGLAYSNVYSELTGGKVAMIADGSWAAATISSADPSFEYGYFPLPGSDTAADNVFGAKYENGFAVSSKSSDAQKDAAFKLIDFASDPANYADFVKKVGFVPALKDASVDGNAFLTEISSQLANSVTEWEYHYFYNAKGPEGTNFPWDYSKIAPLGSETDMTKLAAQLQANLAAGQGR